MIWATGTISNFVVSSATRPANPGNAESAAIPILGPAISYALGQGATLISALWGLLVWKEFRGADNRVRTLVVMMLALFAAGLGLISAAAVVGN
jgi:glucose uptake protein